MSKVKAKRWFSVKAATTGSGADIEIFNNIGDFGITAMDFSESLKALGKRDELRISISSDGGDVSQGFAIYNILGRHPANKIVTVEGLAASMASVIAMVGDTVIMPSNAMMMIHNPWGGIVGEADQIASFGEALETMQDSIAESYVARTGLSKAKVLDMMARETWLSAKKSLELGFADKIEEPMQIAASYDISKFSNVPRGFAANLKKGHTMGKTRQVAADMESDSDDAEGSVKSAAEIRKEVLAHGREVRSLCNLAGFPDKAEGFINADKSISDVIAELDKAKNPNAGKDGKGKGKGVNDDELSAHNSGRTRNDDTPAAVIDHTDIYARWNKTKRPGQ